MNGWVIGLRFLGLGWYVAACIVLGIVGGLGLDELAGTTPLFFVLGTVLGTVVAFWGLYKLVHPVLNSAKRGNMNGKGRKR
ncbi:MAG: AtpZ/AtpI family protein [Dehalococcoidia bacterium]|jgi:F0F1-type ATP synthase assembly protein I|nr:AtpZ/AtpI family protein [Dehalococcoidia bacterium]